MNANNLLELTCQEILGVINPLSGDCTIRLQIIEQLQAIISTVGSLRGTAFWCICLFYAFFINWIPTFWFVKCGDVVELLLNVSIMKFCNVLCPIHLGTMIWNVMKLTMNWLPSFFLITTSWCKFISGFYVTSVRTFYHLNTIPLFPLL